MANKGKVIRALIEASNWRKHAKAAVKAKRWDLAFEYQDNAMACVMAAVKASMERSRRRGPPPSKIGVEQRER